MQHATHTDPITRIAVAGAGYIGQAHMQAIATTPNAQLGALVDPSPSAKTLASKLGVAYFENLNDLLTANTDKRLVDACVVATPNDMHAEQAIACINADVPVLVEKPVAHTVEAAQRLLQVAASSAVPVLVGHHRAHSAIMRQACALVTGGQLGSLVSVVGTAWFFKPDHYFENSPWRKKIGAGPLLLNMIHEIHNLRMLCGEVVHVQAMTGHHTRGFEVEDTASINLRFDSGVLASFAISDTAASPKSWEQTSQENPAYTSYPDQNCYYLAGTRGSLAVPTMQLHTYLEDTQRSWWKPFAKQAAPVTHDDPIANQMAHFVQVARGLQPPLVTVRDGLQNLKIVQAIVHAAHSGAIVDMTSFNPTQTPHP